MPATTNKQRLIAQLFSALKKAYEPKDVPPRPVLEQFVYGLCREGATRPQADEAFRNLCERFFDWNEVRVSSPRELEEVFCCLPDSEARATRLIGFLQQVFEDTYSFDLEPLQKKGLKQAARQLSRFEAANDYVVAWVTQQTLGGHAIPLDAPSLRTLRRLSLVDEDQQDAEVLRASLEHLIPKPRGSLFTDLVSALAVDYCWEDRPNCSACPLCHECPTGQENRREAASSGRTSRPKPR